MHGNKVTSWLKISLKVCSNISLHARNIDHRKSGRSTRLKNDSPAVKRLRLLLVQTVHGSSRRSCVVKVRELSSVESAIKVQSTNQPDVNTLGLFGSTSAPPLCSRIYLLILSSKQYSHAQAPGNSALQATTGDITAKFHATLCCRGLRRCEAFDHFLTPAKNEHSTSCYLREASISATTKMPNDNRMNQPYGTEVSMSPAATKWQNWPLSISLIHTHDYLRQLRATVLCCEEIRLIEHGLTSH